MGYNAGEYENNDAASIYNTLPKTDIVTIVNHADAGIMQINPSSGKQYLFAKATAALSSSDRALSNYASEALSDTKLIIFAGCKSGLTSSVLGNLVDMAVDKGAFCCIGFEETIFDTDLYGWLEQFYAVCIQCKKLVNVIKDTNTWLKEH